MPTTPEQHAPKQEDLAGNERKERLRRKLKEHLAVVALLAILVANYSKKDSDHLFKDTGSHTGSSADYSGGSQRAESPFFGLVNNAFKQETPSAQPIPRPAPAVNVAPDMRPAPFMSDEALGPHLPEVPFANRVNARDVSARPSETDVAAATRANEMYQSSLWNAGEWRGGEITPEQHKAAARDMARNAHPDLPTTTQADADALKAFNSSNARSTTPADTGSDRSTAS